MPITYINGNLFEYIQPGDNLIHCCNNLGVMGSGFVVPLMAHFPGIREQYQKESLELGHCQFIRFYGDPDKHGCYEIVTNGSYNPGMVTVVNMIAQNGVVGQNNPHPLDYIALKNCLNYISDNTSKNRRIVGPKFGAGLAGGDWHKIALIIEDVLGYREVVIYVV